MDNAYIYIYIYIYIYVYIFKYILDFAKYQFINYKFIILLYICYNNIII